MDTQTSSQSEVQISLPPRSRLTGRPRPPRRRRVRDFQTPTIPESLQIDLIEARTDSDSGTDAEDETHIDGVGSAQARRFARLREMEADRLAVPNFPHFSPDGRSESLPSLQRSRSIDEGGRLLSRRNPSRAPTRHPLPQRTQFRSVSHDPRVHLRRLDRFDRNLDADTDIDPDDDRSAQSRVRSMFLMKNKVKGGPSDLDFLDGMSSPPAKVPEPSTKDLLRGITYARGKNRENRIVMDTALGTRPPLPVESSTARFGDTRLAGVIEFRKRIQARRWSAPRGGRKGVPQTELLEVSDEESVSSEEEVLSREEQKNRFRKFKGELRDALARREQRMIDVVQNNRRYLAELLATLSKPGRDALEKKIVESCTNPGELPEVIAFLDQVKQKVDRETRERENEVDLPYFRLPYEVRRRAVCRCRIELLKAAYIAGLDLLLMRIAAPFIAGMMVRWRICGTMESAAWFAGVANFVAFATRAFSSFLWAFVSEYTGKVPVLIVCQFSLFALTLLLSLTTNFYYYCFVIAAIAFMSGSGPVGTAALTQITVVARGRLRKVDMAGHYSPELEDDEGVYVRPQGHFLKVFASGVMNSISCSTSFIGGLLGGFFYAPFSQYRILAPYEDSSVGRLSQTFPLFLPYVCAAALHLIGAVLACTMQEIRATDQKLDKDEAKTTDADSPRSIAVVPETETSPPESPCRAAFNIFAVALVALYALQGFSMTLISRTVPIVMALDRHLGGLGWDPAKIGGVAMLYGCFCVLASLIITLVPCIKLLKPSISLVISVIVIVPFVPFYPELHYLSEAGVWPLLILFCAGRALCAEWLCTFICLLAANSVPSYSRGIFNGFKSCVGNLGKALGPLFGSLVLAGSLKVKKFPLDLHTSLIVAIVGYLIILVIASFLPPSLDTHNGNKEDRAKMKCRPCCLDLWFKKAGTPDTPLENQEREDQESDDFDMSWIAADDDADDQEANHHHHGCCARLSSLFVKLRYRIFKAYNNDKVKNAVRYA